MKLLTLEAVKQAMMEKIKGSLLDAKDAAKLKFQPMTALQVKELDVPAAVAGFRIPYFSFDGKQSKFWRLRYLEDTRKGFDVLNGRKPLRYVQPSGGCNEIYLSPYVDWRKMAENVSIPLVITEGELKASSATKQGIPTIGLGGVWSFKSNRQQVSLLPMLREITWKERRVIICYDSDAVTNPDVVMAENHLARVLTEEGADVFIARIPFGEGGAKVGIDDYLLTHSIEEFKTLLMTANSFSESFALHEMNERVVYVKDPGLIYSYESKMRIRCSDFTSHAYSNMWFDSMKDGKVLRKQTAPTWLHWPMRGELERMTFAPGQPKTFNNQLNTWDGWPVEPKKGSVAMWKELLDHLFSETEPEARKWFEQWCAYPLQHPGAKMASTVLFWGGVQGSGKTMVGWTLMRIYGKYSAEITDEEIEDERFDWAENIQFALADDITGTSNRRLANRLKTMTTQKTLKINPKYVPRYTVPDCVNYYFTANDPDAFFLDDGDRRHFVHEVKSGRLTEDFKDAYVKWKDSTAGAAALFQYLLDLDMTGFHPFSEPFHTAAKNDMIDITKSDLGTWVKELKNNPDRALKLPGDLFTAKELLLMYDPMGAGKVTANGLARELKRGGFRAPGNGNMVVSALGNLRLYCIRNPDFWKKKKPKEIADHYEANRRMEPVQKSKPKF